MKFSTNSLLLLMFISNVAFGDTTPQKVPKIIIDTRTNPAIEKILGHKRGLRMLPEAAAIAAYGDAWSGTKGTNPQDIVDMYTDDGPISYRDILSNNITSKAELKSYLTSLFARFPRQTWGIDGRLYADLVHPGEWTYYYHFTMYRNFEDQTPALSGTGMERVTFDKNSKFISDEVHLIFDQPPYEVAEKIKGLGGTPCAGSALMAVKNFVSSKRENIDFTLAKILTYSPSQYSVNVSDNNKTTSFAVDFSNVETCEIKSLSTQTSN